MLELVVERHILVTAIAQLPEALRGEPHPRGPARKRQVLEARLAEFDTWHPEVQAAMEEWLASQP